MNQFDDPAPYVQTQREGQEAFELMDKVLAEEQNSQESALKKACYLYQLREMKGWEALGYDSEVAMFSGNNLDVRTHQRMRRAAKFYLEYGMDPKEWITWGYSKLAMLGASCEKDTWQEVLDDYEGLSQKDIQAKLRGEGVEKEPETYECPRCGWKFERKDSQYRQPPMEALHRPGTQTKHTY